MLSFLVCVLVCAAPMYENDWLDVWTSREDPLCDLVHDLLSGARPIRSSKAYVLPSCFDVLKIKFLCSRTQSLFDVTVLAKTG